MDRSFTPAAFDNTSAVTAINYSTFAVSASSLTNQAAISKELTATVGMIVSAIAVIANAVVLVQNSMIYFY